MKLVKISYSQWEAERRHTSQFTPTHPSKGGGGVEENHPQTALHENLGSVKNHHHKCKSKEQQLLLAMNKLVYENPYDAKHYRVE